MSTVEQVLSLTDPGDDMQRRLRYQASYGALLCLNLIADNDLSEVFCEHHEDFLIKKKAGKYIGVQVKTRLPGEGPFKTTDEAVKNAFIRFVELEITFPDQFMRFTLVANCDFYDVGKAETNLRHVLDLLRSKPATTFNGSMKLLIGALQAHHNCTKKLVLFVLSKVYLEGSVPKFDDMGPVITAFIAKVRPDILEYRAVEACATALIERVLKASALSCDDPMRSRYMISSSPADAELQAKIGHKRIIQADVLDLLHGSTQTMLVPVASGNIVPTEMPTGTHILERKMAAGEISAPSISMAKDHQASAEHALQVWIARYGPETAIKRRDHVDVAIRTLCTEAQDTTAVTGKPYGASMLNEVRKELRELAKDKDHVFGLKYEHLLGFVSLATQACRVWWSDKFSLEDPDVIV